MKTLSELPILIYCLCFCGFNILEATAYEDIMLRLYRKNNVNYEQAEISKGEILFQEHTGYKPSLPLVLLVHGMSMGADCYFVNGLIEAFEKRNVTEQYNIFAVDMPTLFENSIRNEFYIGILSNVQPAGERIGNFLSKVIELKLITPEKINLIGYSMGAQVAGYAARVVKNNFRKIHFIAGLDPAGPGFHTTWSGQPPLTHVSAADANITHFYHTNSISCGTRDRVATADFVFNKGTVQPGCTTDKGLDCSHTRVPKLYIEAVSKPKNYIARECPSWKEFTDCHCNSHKYVSITFPPDTSAKGIYFLRTRSKSPFGLGRKGSRCSRIIMPHGKLTIDANTLVRHNIERIEKSLNYSQKPKNRKKKHFKKGVRKSGGRHRYVTHKKRKQKHNYLKKKEANKIRRVTEEHQTKILKKVEKEDQREDKMKDLKETLKKDKMKEQKEDFKEDKMKDQKEGLKKDKIIDQKEDLKEDKITDQKEVLRKDKIIDQKEDLKKNKIKDQKEDQKEDRKDNQKVDQTNQPKINEMETLKV